MYKLDPVVADGGEVILHAGHIQEISQKHGAMIRQIGYHVRDYFVKQWETFGGYPWGVLAYSTHLHGAGTFESGVERARIQVTLATGIPREICEQVNLGYRNPASIDPRVLLERQSEDLLVVPQAGETVYRERSYRDCQCHLSRQCTNGQQNHPKAYHRRRCPDARPLDRKIG
jgi:hypothetical protein